MLKAPRILVRAFVLAASAAAAAGCGQRGPLYLPTAPAASQRATLPQTLSPTASPAEPGEAAAPAAGAPASAVR